MANRYTDEQESVMREALIANGGNISAAARATGMPYAVMHRRKERYLGLSDSIVADETELWGRVSTAVATKMLERIPQESDLGALTYAAKVAAQNHLDYRDGRKGSAINVHNGDVNTLVVEYRDDWRG